MAHDKKFATRQRAVSHASVYRQLRALVLSLTGCGLTQNTPRLPLIRGLAVPGALVSVARLQRLKKGSMRDELHALAEK